MIEQWVNAPHFKMEGIATLQDLLKLEDWMVKVDLKDAYFTIPIHPHHQQFMWFSVEGQCYQFKKAIELAFYKCSVPARNIWVCSQQGEVTSTPLEFLGLMTNSRSLKLMLLLISEDSPLLLLPGTVRIAVLIYATSPANFLFS